MDKSKKNLIYILIAFAFMLLFPLIPAPEGLTTMSMQAFGLFIGIMILWNFVGIDWPSFLCMAMIAIYGLMKPAAIFSSGLPDGILHAESCSQSGWILPPYGNLVHDQ